MDLSVVIAGKSYGVDLARPKSLAIALDFDGPQPTFFGAPKARTTPLRGGGFIGDTRQGGSCNVAEIRMVPHCNGTHTESLGHVVDAPHAVVDALPQSLMPARLISVTPVPASATEETYRPAPDDGDRLITRAALLAALDSRPDEELTALALRTLPNDTSKTTAEYGDRRRPAFFSTEAMQFISGRGVRHLLVDIPSIDRMHDDGLLANHRLFWNLPDGARDSTPAAQGDRTVTEMIFVADGIADGLYLLNLQIPAFRSDAAPSRPVLYDLAPLR